MVSGLLQDGTPSLQGVEETLVETPSPQVLGQGVNWPLVRQE